MNAPKDHRDNRGDWDWAIAHRNFEAVWNPSRWRIARPPSPVPPVTELLEVDREYRMQAARRPESTQAGFQIRIRRDHRQFIAQFALPLRAGSHNHFDRVLLQVDGSSPGLSYTIFTARSGQLRGARVVRGREAECLAFYRVPGVPVTR